MFGENARSETIERTRKGVPSAVRRVTTVGAIYEALLGEIVSLALLPGTPIQEKLLCERFNIGRTPVREAMIRLSEASLVDILPRSGTFVSRVPVDAIPEAVLVRKALESLTVEAAATAPDPRRAAKLDMILERQKIVARLDDTRAFHEADEAFHEAIAAIGGHAGIWKLLSRAKVRIDRVRRLTPPVLGRMDQVIGEHEIIRDAIARGDAEAAKEAMTAHLGAVIPDVAELRGRYPGYFV